MSNTKKVLLVTTVSGFVPQFEMNNVRILQEMGYEVHYASNYHTPSYGTDNHRLDGTGIVRHQIDFVRSPFDIINFKVYRQLCKVMKEEHFSLVHCHTPMGGVMARLAARATHTGPVIYTAHGFHFFRGASMINWLLYYPMERFLSRFTDQQICINQEDYQRAKKTFHCRYVSYIPGVGLDPQRIPQQTPEDIRNKRRELGYPEDAFILMSSGELIRRKNHETILRAIARLRTEGTLPPHLNYVICGHGALEQHLKDLAKQLDIEDLVIFAGYREDMTEVYRTADIFIFPSYQEGLPMSLLEAMACGCPVICSDIRGSKDLMGAPLSEETGIRCCAGGIMVNRADDVEAYCTAILKMTATDIDLSAMGQSNQERSRNFCSDKVLTHMKKIYHRLLSIPEGK